MPYDLSLKSMAAKASLDHACPRLTIKNSMGCGFCNTLTCDLARLSEFVRSPKNQVLTAAIAQLLLFCLGCLYIYPLRCKLRSLDRQRMLNTLGKYFPPNYYLFSLAGCRISSAKSANFGPSCSDVTQTSDTRLR